LCFADVVGLGCTLQWLEEQLEGASHMHKERTLTTDLLRPGDTTGITPEFGRCNDVQRLFGLRRGTLYNLLRQGKVKGVLLRVAGQKSGVRLWHLQSIRDLINSEMEAA
jgi:hypothetical protein